MKQPDRLRRWRRSARLACRWQSLPIRRRSMRRNRRSSSSRRRWASRRRGERLAAQVEAEIAAARDLARRITNPPHVLFLYLRGTDVQQVAGRNTPVDVMIAAAGGINAAAEAGIVEFKPLSPEVVIAAQPDVLLVLDKGLESVGGVDGLLKIPGLADTPAGMQRRVITLDDLYLLGMGPRTGQALTDLTIAFYDASQGSRP
jgi:iron complex transport system substrate-binding protein